MGSTLEFLLSKPANIEQIQIAERLEQSGAVIVQGPPGTGKTHTIANLIGHLLAQGKSVLVTAHTPKALRVLRDKVENDLQALCVSVIDNDLDSMRQLESSIGTIVEKLTSTDCNKLDINAVTVKKRRSDLLKSIQEVTKQLFDAYASEYTDICFLGNGYGPSDAARLVAAQSHSHGWIPGNIEIGVPCPLSTKELEELYKTNGTLTKDEQEKLEQWLPSISSLPKPTEFANVLQALDSLEHQDTSFGADYWKKGADQISQEVLPALKDLFDALRKADQIISTDARWKLEAIEAGLKDSDRDSCPWHGFMALAEESMQQAAQIQGDIIVKEPRLPDGEDPEEQAVVLEQILMHLVRGKRLNWLTLKLKKRWSSLIEGSLIDGKRPKAVSDFEFLLSYAQLLVMRARLDSWWTRLAVPHDAPGLSSFELTPEVTATRLSQEIKNLLSWHNEQWIPTLGSLEELGFDTETILLELPVSLEKYGQICQLKTVINSTLIKCIEARISALELELAKKQIVSVESNLEGCTDGRIASVAKDLLEAVRSREPSSYKSSYELLESLSGLRLTYDRRKFLVTKLATAAPAWAQEIYDRVGIHEPDHIPGNPQEAWLWKQLEQELTKRQSVDTHELQDKLEVLQDELKRRTTELIDHLSWSSQIRRTNNEQRQALVGWLDIQRRIGKGTGKRVPLLRAEASRHLSKCKEAVPVWIMPMSKVIDAFDPASSTFDVVIIDEASQSDVMTLLCLYLAKNAVIVGDHEQVSPSAIGQRLDVVQNLIDTLLQGIPNSILYDGQTSVYDLARQSFGSAICLREHFRCVPEIIEFSNWLSYEGKIKPLRESGASSLKPALIPYRVPGARGSDKINKEECLTIASLLMAACEQPEYIGKDFGVVSLLGEEQAIEIEKLLRTHIDPQEYEERRILCGNAAQFQGDERHVMFISLVDVANDGPLSMRDQPQFRQRFNVAVSRAADQLWVVHSLNQKVDLKQGDLRRRLLEHLDDPFAYSRTMETLSNQSESDFEREVLQRLLAAGYEVIPQLQVGYYRIDLVVDDGQKRLAIECDGDRYHPIEKLPEDMERQAILERRGWKFARIRGSHYYRDPEGAMAPVFDKLEKLGIKKTLSNTKESSQINNELIERVTNRAAEIRKMWNTESGEESSQKSQHANCA